MAFIDEWRRWHAERIEALAMPYGPLASARTDSLTWPSRPTLQVVGGPLLRVPYVATGATLDHARLSDQQRHLLEHEGSLALDQADDAALGAPTGGIEVFEPHPDWIVPAEVDDPVFADGSSVDEHTATVHFRLDGRAHALVVTRQPRGTFHAVFADLTRDARFPARHLHVPAPDDLGRTFLDFNRAVLPLGALTWRFPNVDAPARNRLDAAVTAGEHRSYEVALRAAAWQADSAPIS